jgi:zinc protease
MRTIMFLAAVLAFPAGYSTLMASPAEDPGRVVALSEPDSPLIAINVWVKVGSQNDPQGKEGLAALTADLLSDSSTRQDTYEQILAKLYPMAAGYGFNVDKEMTVFSGQIHRDNLVPYWDLFRNAIVAPGFKEEDFKRIKTQTLNFLKQARRYSNDEELSKELLYWAIYKGTPYEHPEEGYVRSVETITLEDVKAFYAKYYTRDNVVVGVAGGFPPDFAAQMRNEMDKLPPGRIAETQKPAPAPLGGIKVLIVEKDTKATPISFGFPIELQRSNPDFHAMMLANSWFGEHRTSVSHLYQVIRETRGMNYGDYSYIEAYPKGYSTQVPPTNVSRRSQIFEVWLRPIAMTAPGTLHDRSLFAFRAALRELASLVDKGMTAEAFETQQRYLDNYSVNFGNTIGRRLAYRMDDAFYGIPDPGFLASMRKGFDALTLSTVNSALKKRLQAQNLWVVFITQDAEGLKKKLLEGTETNIAYAGKQPQNVLDEDKIIARYPIPVKPADITILNIDQVFESK